MEMEQQMIYLDNSATTPLCDEVRECLIANMDKFGNPSSLYGLGVDAAQAFRLEKETILSALGDDSGELLITSGGTEGDNTAIFGAVGALRRRGKKIVTTSVEHPAVLNAMHALEKEGFTVTYVEPRDGVLLADDVVNAVDQETILVSVMKVNNETGSIFPVEEIARRVKAKNKIALVHCDFVQGFMKCPLQLRDIDLVSVSGHKIHAPKGVGALYIKKGVRILPMLYGGGQQRNLRPGTENTLLTAAMAAAVTAANRHGHGQVRQCYDKLMHFAENTPGVVCNTLPGGLPYIVNLSVMGIRSETMLHFLEEEEIYVSSGSACSKGKKSAVLSAFGWSDDRVDSALRISFSRFTTPEDVDRLTDAILEGMATLQYKRG